MTTSADVDDELVEEARLLGGHSTGQAAIAAALRDYVSRRRVASPSGDRLAILDLFGQIEYDEDYDYKAERRRDSHRVARALATLDQPPPTP